MSKSDLVGEARRRGLTVNERMTVAELEAVLAADPNVASRNASPLTPCPRCGRKNPHVHA